MEILKNTRPAKVDEILAKQCLHVSTRMRSLKAPRSWFKPRPSMLIKNGIVFCRSILKSVSAAFGLTLQVVPLSHKVIPRLYGGL